MTQVCDDEDLSPWQPYQPTSGRMVLGNATLHWAGEQSDWAECVESWYDTAAAGWYPRYEVYRKPMMQAYQEIYEKTREGIIGYIHDDVLICEHGWDRRVLKEFNDPTVGMVGFFGARRHGAPDMYKGEFDPYKMGRYHTLSNFIKTEKGGTNAEEHGTRFEGEADVSVFDGCAIFVRREVLNKCGGWPQGTPCSYWIYDYNMSCESRRHGYRNRYIGVKACHLESRSPSIISEDWKAAHRWLWDRSRDVLPFEAE